MRIPRLIALLFALLGAVACAALHLWTFTRSWNVDRADAAVAILGVAVFAVMIPAAIRSKRLGLGPLSTSDPQPSRLMAVAPYVFLYAIVWFFVPMVVLEAGGVHARKGRYFQNPSWGRIRDTEWEIPFATYKRLHGFEVSSWAAFLFLFYYLSLATFALDDPDESDESDESELGQRRYSPGDPLSSSGSDTLVPAELDLRRSARLIILDPRGRLLLFRYHDEHKPPFWSTAGGELQEGEDYRDAARRELQEETGFRFAVGPLLHEREDVYAVARSKPARWVEQYFLVECDCADAPSRANWTEEERTTIQDWKWWSLSEMREQPESFLPNWLGDLLESTLSRARKVADGI